MLAKLRIVPPMLTNHFHGKQQDVSSAVQQTTYRLQDPGAAHQWQG